MGAATRRGHKVRGCEWSERLLLDALLNEAGVDITTGWGNFGPKELQLSMRLMAREVDDAIAIATEHTRTTRLMAEEKATIRLHGRIKIADPTTRAHRREYRRHQDPLRSIDKSLQCTRHDGGVEKSSGTRDGICI